jgi:hypothetical protein
MTNGSPPKPHDGGTVTDSTAATATAASKALPPAENSPIPAETASGEIDTTTPPLL